MGRVRRHQFSLLPNNLFLYSSPSGQFQMFPWGTDQAWEGPLDFDGDAGLMFDKCIADPACKSTYMDALRSAAGAIEGLELDSLATDIASRLVPWQAMEASPFREYDADEVEQGVEDTREVIADRPDELSEWLESQPEEPELDPGPEPTPPVNLPAGVSGIVQRDALGLTRLRLSSAAVVDALLHVTGPGNAGVTGKIRTRHGFLGVCKTDQAIQGAGETTLRCRLSEVARKRLRERWLKLHLTAWFAFPDGELETIERKVVIPRIDRD